MTKPNDPQSSAWRKGYALGLQAGRAEAIADALRIIRGAWASGAISGRCEEVIEALQAEKRT